MRSWLLTNIMYGNWLPRDGRGSVTSVRDRRPGDPHSLVRIEHDIPGEPYEDELPELHDSARRLMNGPPITFQLEHAELVMAQFLETADYRSWLIRSAAIMFNHFHLVVQVPGDPSPKKVLADFKAYASRVLNVRFGKPPSETWWTTNGSKRKLGSDEAVVNANVYVLEKQPNPLVIWQPSEQHIEAWFHALASRERQRLEK